MTNKILVSVGALLIVGPTLALVLPTIVHSLGIHPTYEGATYALPGQRALIVTTSHGVLNKPGETDDSTQENLDDN